MRRRGHERRRRQQRQRRYYDQTCQTPWAGAVAYRCNIGAGTITANYDGRQKHRTRIGKGARIGSNNVLVAPVEVGDDAYTGAGAVVTRDVPDFALVAGTPARRIGWVGHAGVRLEPSGDGRWRCPQTGKAYTERDGILSESDQP